MEQSIHAARRGDSSDLDEFRTLIEERSAILFDASRERFFARA